MKSNFVGTNPFIGPLGTPLVHECMVGADVALVTAMRPTSVFVSCQFSKHSDACVPAHGRSRDDEGLGRENLLAV